VQQQVQPPEQFSTVEKTLLVVLLTVQPLVQQSISLLMVKGGN
jgi:hypothetical protein